MAGWALSLGIIGTVTGVLGVASGVYSFILSGYRVKIHLGFAILKTNGDHIEFESHWKGNLDEFEGLLLGSKSLQVLVQARNSGRSKIEVRQVFLQNYRKKGTKEEHQFFVISGPPIEGEKLPHLLDFGSSCSWLIPLEDIKILGRNTLYGKEIRRPIYAEINLAVGKQVFSNRTGLTPERVDAIQAKWESFMKEKS